MREVLYRLGRWREGMTRRGVREPGAARSSRAGATKWRGNDLVIRLEQDDAGDCSDDVAVIYLIVGVPRGHCDVASDDHSSCQVLEGVPVPAEQRWDKFLANELTAINLEPATII
jgi:hypothetical protein